MRNASFTRHGLLALALAASLTGPAAAVGRSVDVQVIDWDSGRSLPVYAYRGESHIPGRPGARYAIALRNLTDERVLAAPRRRAVPPSAWAPATASEKPPGSITRSSSARAARPMK